MRDEQPSLQAAQGFFGDCGKWWCILHHRIADAGQLLYEGRNLDAGIDQLLPFAHGAIGINLNDADFSNAVMGGGSAGGFKVDKGEWVHADNF